MCRTSQTMSGLNCLCICDLVCFFLPIAGVMARHVHMSENLSSEPQPSPSGRQFGGTGREAEIREEYKVIGSCYSSYTL